MDFFPYSSVVCECVLPIYTICNMSQCNSQYRNRYYDMFNENKILPCAHILYVQMYCILCDTEQLETMECHTDIYFF